MGRVQKIGIAALCAASQLASVIALASISPIAEAKEGGLEEVLVTARRREELLQETPVAVSAISGEMMLNAGFSDLTDLEKMAPSLQFGQDSEKSSAIFIRGIGQRTTNDPALDPGVGLYLNNIYIPRQDTQLLDAVDVQSIQVLRGPQGTLFGKNNIGGAILVTTKDVNYEQLDWKITSDIGQYGTQILGGSANVPISENAGFRINVMSKKIGGYFPNSPSKEDFGGDYGDQNRTMIFLRGRMDVGENFVADVFLNHSSTDELGAYRSCIVQDESTAVMQLLWRGKYSSYAEACRESESLIKDRKVALNSDRPQVYAIDSDMAALKMSFDIAGVDAELTTSWGRQYNINIYSDIDGTALNVANMGNEALEEPRTASGFSSPDERRSQFTQEIKFQGDAFENKLNFTFGAFYSDEKISDNYTAGSENGDKGLVAAPLSFFADTVGLPLPGPNALVVPILNHSNVLTSIANESYAVFLQVDFDFFTEWLRLTIGDRYTVDKRARTNEIHLLDYDAYAAGLNAQIGSSPDITTPIQYLTTSGLFSPISEAQFRAYTAIPPPLLPAETVSGTYSSKSMTPTMTLSWVGTEEQSEMIGVDSFLLYGTVSTGIKAGGVGRKGAALNQYDPEEVLNKEIGFKIDAFDRHFRLNGAVYAMDYTELQVSEVETDDLGIAVMPFTSNAGEAEVTGYELESSLVYGNAFMMASFSHTKGTYLEYAPLTNTRSDGLVAFDRSHEPFPLVPENTASLMVSYDIRSELGLFSPQLQVSYTDEIYTGFDYRGTDHESSWLPSYKLYSFRLNWTDEERLSVGLYVNNIQDKVYFSGGIAVSDLVGTNTIALGSPRHFGINISYKSKN